MWGNWNFNKTAILIEMIWPQYKFYFLDRTAVGNAKQALLQSRVEDEKMKIILDEPILINVSNTPNDNTPACDAIKTQIEQKHQLENTGL